MRLNFIDAGLKKNVSHSICGTTCYYNEIRSPYTGKIWLDRNLGANRIPISSTDYMGHGTLFQWGRLIDGHQCINWTETAEYSPVFGTTSTLSTTNTPVNSLFITASSSPNDWRNPQNNALWQGGAGANNPCPSGYRIPTQTEFQNETTNFETADAAGAYSSFLRLSKAGYRSYTDGVMTNVSDYGYYWTSTINGSRSMSLVFSNIALSFNDLYRATGYCVRAIKDE